MFDHVLKKLRSEVTLLLMVATFSIALSIFLVADSTLGLAIEQYGLPLTVLRVLELVFAITWLLLSISMAWGVNRLSKTLYKICSLNASKGSDEEQIKDEISESVRTLIAFYRDNYLKINVVVTFALTVSFLIILTVSLLLLIGSMSFWVAVFRWAVNSSMLLILSAFYVHISRGWRRKLLKVRDAEKKFSEILGEPIEA
jgi:hypothetical protein